MTDCDSRTTIDEYLSGKFELRKLNYRDVTEGGVSGSFFLGIGGISDNRHEVSKIRFSWKTPKGDYAISEFPIDDIRVDFDSTITDPYIMFTCETNECYEYKDTYINSDFRFYEDIIYVTIYCKEEDYTIDVNVNDVR
jgi:hypothetical protein